MGKEINGIDFAELSMSIDQGKFKKLLAIVDQSDQVKLKVLFNAVIKCTKDYNTEPSSIRLKDWQKAEAALEEFSAQLWERHCPGEESLSNVQAVLSYLLDVGWQVSQSGLYKHRKGGKIVSQPDGTFLQKDVDKYAKAFLKQKATGKKKQDAQDELQRQKLEKELTKLDTDNARSQLKLEVEEGKYIPKDQMFLELASRAGVLEAGLKHWIQSMAAEWINLVNGDIKRAGELIAAQGLSIDELINQYATMKEFQVIIEGIEDEEPE